MSTSYYDDPGFSGYRVPGAVWSAPSGVKVDPYDPAFSSDGGAVGDESKPAVYLFSNSRDGDGVAYAMADDGTVLGTHLCSHWGYMRHDLHDRDNGERCKEHYPDGYRLIVLTEPGSLPPAQVIALNKAQAEQAKAAGDAS